VPEVAKSKNVIDTSKDWPSKTSKEDISAIRKALAQCYTNTQTVVSEQWPLYSIYCFEKTSAYVAHRHGLERIPKDDPLARYFYRYMTPPIDYTEVLEDVEKDYYDYFYGCLRESALLTSMAGYRMIENAMKKLNGERDAITQYTELKQKAASEKVCFPLEGYVDNWYLEKTPTGKLKFDNLLYHLLNCALLDQKIVEGQWKNVIGECFSDLKESLVWKGDLRLKEESTVVGLKEEFRRCLVHKTKMEWMNTAQINIKQWKSVQNIRDDLEDLGSSEGVKFKSADTR